MPLVVAAAAVVSHGTAAAIPSIVYGLWGVFVLVPFVRGLEAATPDALRALPLFSGPPIGVGMLSAALILAVMVTPFNVVHRP